MSTLYFTPSQETTEAVPYKSFDHVHTTSAAGIGRTLRIDGDEEVKNINNVHRRTFSEMGNTHVQQQTKAKSNHAKASKSNTNPPKRLRKKGVKHKSFDERFQDLMVYKTTFGHFIVPKTILKDDKYHSLAVWCDNLRQSYRKIEQGKNPHQKLSKANIERLENIGFRWRLRKEYLRFDSRFNELMAFKAKYGHCNVAQRTFRPGMEAEDRHVKYRSLGKWCSDIRCSYRALQQGSVPNSYKKLTRARIEKLESEGFTWNLKNIEKTKRDTKSDKFR